MAQAFVACYWLPLEEDTGEIFRLARELECDLLFDPSTTFIDKYEAIPVVISAAAEEFISIYRSTLAGGHYADFRGYQRIDALPDHYTQREGILPRLLQRLARRNQRIQNNRAFWVAGYCETDLLNRIMLEEIMLFAKKHRIALHYEFEIPKRDQPDKYFLLEIFFKVSHYEQWNLRMDELDRRLLWHSWHIHDVDQHHEFRFEALPQLTLDTIDTFLKDVALYL